MEVAHFHREEPRASQFLLHPRRLAATRHVRLTLVTSLSAAIRLPADRRTWYPSAVWQVLLW